MLHRQALETYRCLEEGVLNTVEDGDIGSIFGFGFAPQTGGTLSYIDYIGIKKFVADCDEFAAKYGDRFKVPDSLRNRKSMY
jgi:3-hydroxyacyl-CoA dehydrogenase/enoyl-CoA hydratase/3-hydroxybutyryl-CoA epimerase